MCSLSACKTTRTVQHTYTPESSLNDETRQRVRYRAPRIRDASTLGVESRPLAIHEFRRTVNAPEAGVVEVIADGNELTITTARGQTTHRLPPRGEVKTFRPDSVGFSEFLSGRAEEQTIETEIPKRSGMEIFFRGVNRNILWIGILVIILVAAYIVVSNVAAGNRRRKRLEEQRNILTEE